MFADVLETCAAPATKPDRHRYSLTCFSDDAAAPLTLSGAEAMTDPIVVLCLLLTTGTLAVLGAGKDKYRREDGTFTNTPSATVAAPSVINCAARCNSKVPWFCGGFTYHSGTCQLYRSNKGGTCDNPLEAASLLEVDTGSEPRSYRRLQARDPGEGILTGFRFDLASGSFSCVESSNGCCCCIPARTHVHTAFLSGTAWPNVLKMYGLGLLSYEFFASRG